MTFLYLIGAAVMVWLGFRMVRGNPAAFSRESLGRSFFTLGLLGLLLIGVIFVCVKILR
jgi:threonine/homoserine/homoserine lactone efflux protein